jgi:hypothetical protein
VPLAKRRQLEAQKYRELVGKAGHSDSLSDGEEADRKDAEAAADRPKESLLLATVRMRKDQPEATEATKQLEEEADILKHVLQKQALRAVKELAQVLQAVAHVHVHGDFCVDMPHGHSPRWGFAWGVRMGGLFLGSACSRCSDAAGSPVSRPAPPPTPHTPDPPFNDPHPTRPRLTQRLPTPLGCHVHEIHGDGMEAST